MKCACFVVCRLHVRRRREFGAYSPTTTSSGLCRISAFHILCAVNNSADPCASQPGPADTARAEPLGHSLNMA